MAIFFYLKNNFIKREMFRLNKYFYNKTNKIKNFDFFNRFNLLTMKIFGDNYQIISYESIILSRIDHHFMIIK